jgi:CheY-like chemotaxis protein
MNEGRTILLVEDCEDDLRFMRHALQQAKSNHPLQAVRNGEEAISYLKGEGLYSDRNRFPWPVVMLLDLNLPKKNGFEVLTWVRAQPNLKRLAVFILTASTRDEDVQCAFYLGATSYLAKPSSLDTLVTMMRCLCGWIQINYFPSTHKEEGHVAKRSLHV